MPSSSWAYKLPVKLVYKDVVKSPAQITNVCLEANSNKNCIGIVAWMHTFSPAKMWIRGLTALQKPLLHLHTQSLNHIYLNK